VLSVAIVTSIDRATGALDANNTSALRNENKAALTDARLAAQALHAAVALLPRAINQLGAVHERGTKALRSFLLSIGSSLTTDADGAQSIFNAFAAQHPS
jgi:hypothetical protein